MTSSPPKASTNVENDTTPDNAIVSKQRQHARSSSSPAVAFDDSCWSDRHSPPPPP
eukprot:CAMPEP_0172497944 /NCGR_PEP_ID=MMETSP1066-20121228/107336_1 /TAXON_ID=671091 /ORGANISM="Coscinodiscus wailesii, Strain CCMP2513" /LENGTH=55 /DNA_ID=CAMNT_0013270991 /DNA_START=73 /DNA_END=237 /DNA_ORIENTATION=+